MRLILLHYANILLDRGAFAGTLPTPCFWFSLVGTWLESGVQATPAVAVVVCVFVSDPDPDAAVATAELGVQSADAFFYFCQPEFVPSFGSGTAAFGHTST